MPTATSGCGTAAARARAAATPASRCTEPGFERPSHPYLETPKLAGIPHRPADRYAQGLVRGARRAVQGGDAEPRVSRTRSPDDPGRARRRFRKAEEMMPALISPHRASALPLIARPPWRLRRSRNRHTVCCLLDCVASLERKRCRKTPSLCPSPSKLALASLHRSVAVSASGYGWERERLFNGHGQTPSPLGERAGVRGSSQLHPEGPAIQAARNSRLRRPARTHGVRYEPAYRGPVQQGGGRP